MVKGGIIMRGKASNILVAEAIKNNGDWAKIEGDIRRHELPSEEEVEAASFVQAITILDPEYPEVLKESYKPPFVLFYKGDIGLLKKDYAERLAVVGSRDLLSYNEWDIEQILKPLVTKYDIVSGLALGANTAAHNAAIRNGGKTIVVLGGGINKCYPQSNKPLLQEIIEKGGLILSEYPPECEPTTEQFLTRHRIIANLCKKMLVTEIRVNSGTQTAVSFALLGGRDVYVLPVTLSGTLVVSECYNNKLIADGASIYYGPECLED